MNTCKTCKWWGNHWSLSRHPNEIGGTCDHPKMLKGYQHTSVPSDGAIIEDDEGWGWVTGPDFGCIHHEEKK